MKNDPHGVFLELYQKIHASFVRYCSSKSYGIMDTEDLVQEAILIALKRFDQIRDKEKLLSYLIGTVNNIIRNKKRQQRFRGEWNEHLLDHLESKAPSPEIAADIHFLLKAMEQLPAKQQEALILFEISGFSIREISLIQESSESATKTRLSRSRQKLKELLSDRKSSKSLSATLAAYASVIL